MAVALTRVVTILVVTFSVSGCFLRDIDATYWPSVSSLVGSTYTIRNDSWLLANGCTQESLKKHCAMIQKVGGEVHWVDAMGGFRLMALPIDEAQYKEDQRNWDVAVAKIPGYVFTKHDERRRLDRIVPAGTSVTVTRVISVSQGTSGRCWVVQGHLNEQYQRPAIEFPGCAYGAPMWFEYGDSEAPAVNFEMLKPSADTFGVKTT